MSSNPDDRGYTESHEWVIVEDGVATIGITDHAQDELGEVVYVDIPDRGGEPLAAGDEFGSIESVKAVSELFLPVDGAIIEVNAELEDNPGLINEDPWERGWIIKVQMEAEHGPEFLDAEAYANFVASESH